MNKLLVGALSFILLVSLFGCTKELEDKSYDVTPSPNVSIEQGLREDTQPTQTEQAKQPQPQQTAEEPPVLLPCATFDLPERIDPLGVFGDEDIFSMRPELAILKYNAWPATYDDLYVIEGVEIGRDTLPIISIKTNNEDKVEYVETIIYSADPRFIFEQMAMIYGEPLINEYEDILTGEILELDVEEFGNGSGHNDQWVIWKEDGYYIRLIYGGASGYYGSHIEIIKSKNELRNIWDLRGTLRRIINQERNCLMSDANELFDPTGIFRDKELFEYDIEDVILKYGATKATQSDNKLFMHEYVQNYYTEGFTICGQDAKLVIDHSNPKYKELPENLGEIKYEIDTQNLTHSEIEELLEDISELISSSYGEALIAPSGEAYYWEGKSEDGVVATTLAVYFYPNHFSNEVEIISIIMSPKNIS